MLEKMAQTPVYLTPLHKEFNRSRDHPVLAPKREGGARQDKSCAHTPACAPAITPEQVKELRDLVAPGIVLTPEDGEKYHQAVCTGNLLYARKMPGAIVMTDEAGKLGETVKFAREYNIELTIKNGGHSYAGYCLNCGGILVFMNTGKFGPSGIKVDLKSTPKTVTIPAGCLWSDIHDYFRENHIDQMVIGGRCPSVGVSGFTLGGGVSPFSRRYGLGVDAVLRANIVTASGDCIQVSHEDTDPKKKDLFWALRGGGGGNFGILTEFTAQIYDLAQNDGTVAYGLLTWELPSQQTQFEEMMKVYNSEKWPDRLALDVIWQYKLKQGSCNEQTLVAEVIVIYDGTLGECLQVIEPLTRFAFKINIDSMKWWDVVVIEQGYEPKCPTQFFSHWASLVFGQGAITETVVSDITKLMEESRDLLNQCDPFGSSNLIWVHIGEETAKIGAKDTAFFWRDGVYVCYFKIQWTSCRVTDEMFNFVNKVKDKLVPHTIQGKAAYVNFVDSTIPNWQEAYYGDNYPRLQKIKQEWDPKDFFNFQQSIKLPGATAAQTGIEEELHGAVDWNQYSLPDPENN
ncbi:putative FAD-linked oxidoreductase [Rhizoctonia solani 123E]|uniref:Putative FAD-linked oxidoreductase n=1 Tax=Rhizoctonia solani 123E TaxID=1423351 RepID=A0A074RMN0_9AGAM|nr:putative FAD-linked oxidoreductase [Rhizoctonia solani 123E]